MSKINDAKGYVKGDFVKIRVHENEFNGKIEQLIYESKSSVPVGAIVEVASVQKGGPVKASLTEVPITALSPII